MLAADLGFRRTLQSLSRPRWLLEIVSTRLNPTTVILRGSRLAGVFHETRVFNASDL